MRASSLIASSVAGAGLVSAQSRYANNRVPFNEVSEAILANLPDVDMEILSPAFIDPESVNEAFANGTAGPTSQQSLGECIL